MGWEVPLDVDYWGDPQTLMIRAIMDDDTADSYPLRLKCWASKYRKDGQLDDAAQVELACEWRGAKGQLANALLKAGFITASFAIVGWEDEIGKRIRQYEAKKASNRQYQAEHRPPPREREPREPRPAPPEHLPSSKIGLLVDILQRKHCPNSIETLRKWADSWAAKKGFPETEKILNNMPEGMDIIEIRNKYFSAEPEEKTWQEIVKEREEERIRNGRQDVREANIAGSSGSQDQR